MREIRTSGSEGGGAPKGALPTSIVRSYLAGTFGLTSTSGAALSRRKDDGATARPRRERRRRQHQLYTSFRSVFRKSSPRQSSGCRATAAVA
jgi:hypothetical protein